MRFELIAGGDIFLPVELVDRLDDLLLQYRPGVALYVLLKQSSLGTRDVIRILFNRHEWLKANSLSPLVRPSFFSHAARVPEWLRTNSPLPPSPSGNQADAI